MTSWMRISKVFVNRVFMPAVLVTASGVAQGQITYNWQDSKEGWVPHQNQNNGCQLYAQPEAMAMRSTTTQPIMRSGTIGQSLNVQASDYDRVQITLKNPTASQNPNAKLFVYPPESNEEMCQWLVPVDTSMNEFRTYTLDLTTSPTEGTFTGEVARFGWRAPWGVSQGDTIYWKRMVIYNSLGCTNEGACNYEPLAETDNGTCVLVGDSCDDGNPSTLNDVINADCLCGEEVDLLGEMNAAELPSLGPNPAAYDLSVKADHPLGNVRVLDLQGKVWMHERTSSQNLVLDVSRLAPGTYLLETFDRHGRSFSRFVVQRP